jgi:hypothetical protein
MNVSNVLRFSSIATIFAATWFMLPVTAASASTTHHIYYQASGQCLSNDSSGDSVITACVNVAAQEWTIRQQADIDGATYSQWENGNAKCLDLAGSTGPQIVVAACGSTSDHSQFWAGPVIGNGDSYSAIANGFLPDCLTIRVPTESGIQVIASPCKGNAVSLWWAD